MIVSKCFGCCHENVCNYKEEFNRAVFSVLDVTYATEKKSHISLEDSPIVVEFHCPHYLALKGGAE